ncbi:MAG TPA: hypothetical protein VK044_05400 [Virgibacillus sp.]|nr:hypothetical protein [Virgibacillus sp.]
MDLIKKVIRSYGIASQEVIQVTESLYKVNTHQQNYALKKSRLTSETRSAWENVYHEAHAKQLTSVLPLYLTKTGSLYQEENNVIYYLSPWLTGEQATIEQAYRTIGQLHAKTKQEQTMPTEQVVEQFARYQEGCQHLQKDQLTYIKEIEMERYMSPFQLQYCTHFRDVELVFKKLLESIDRFNDEITDMSTWNYSLCHGNLQFSHFFHSGQISIINWEKAHYANPILDLVLFFKNEAIHYDTTNAMLLDLFTTYLEENDLKPIERSLLLIYLLDPTEYVSIVKQHVESRSNATMIHQVKDLQIAYRKLLFGLAFFERLNELTMKEQQIIND